MTKTTDTSRNESLPIEVILSRAIDGDHKAFRIIYDMLSGKMYSLCMRYAGNRNDADDLFQEGFIRLYKNLGGFKSLGSFEGWARRVFVNTCLDHLKRNKKLSFTELTDTNETIATELTGIDKMSNDELVSLIGKLPGGYRTIVNLYLVEGYTHREIAEMTGISEGTSKSQLFRARALLQKGIQEKNG